MPENTSATVEESAVPVATAPGSAVKGTKKDKPERVASMWSDARRDLMHNWVFLVSAVLILALLVIAAFPGLFTSGDPYAKGFCDLSNSVVPPSGAHWFGFDVQGCDIYTRTIYGTRNSIIVGVLTSVLTTLVGCVLGMVAGLRGGWLDVLVSRFTEIWFAIPTMLGGLLVLAMLGTGNVVTVSLIMAVLGWPQLFRIMRGSVITNKQNDYVMAARALGAGGWRIAMRHILPNALAPVIVVSTINLGVYISAEAAFSYLGIGVQSPNISWGLMISDGQDRFLSAPHMVLFPSLFLSVTVLAFIMLGEAVRDALDPKLR
ncbi:ABC transporter permease [Streptomyces sp. WAC05374]|uniref:ABC transporter permease n=1 Tax=Streptomyces sp. WAC05374 TaxID=2487420 RepID=UPI000F8924FA|nr:ABC transporter permease [Streptomyces sp. WAC05374]RST14654.1 ABC transporter permease [Streptomyces sp. WAC05374]TDF43312.1 ABC transporter permease [Streptomyces sp. WAC05374]TDF51098.1 ABC transporter permease [Streptomyces sp. WAC05374]TDF52159.1 ABC transporter permease [Streptomyces sp. WAC05374]